MNYRSSFTPQSYHSLTTGEPRQQRAPHISAWNRSILGVRARNEMMQTHVPAINKSFQQKTPFTFLEPVPREPLTTSSRPVKTHTLIRYGAASQPPPAAMLTQLETQQKPTSANIHPRAMFTSQSSQQQTTSMRQPQAIPFTASQKSLAQLRLLAKLGLYKPATSVQRPSQQKVANLRSIFEQASASASASARPQPPVATSSRAKNEYLSKARIATSSVTNKRDVNITASTSNQSTAALMFRKALRPAAPGLPMNEMTPSRGDEPRVKFNQEVRVRFDPVNSCRPAEFNPKKQPTKGILVQKEKIKL